MKRTSLGVLIVLLLGTIAGAAEAFVGQVLNTISIPAGVQCAGDSGSAVAVVPGGKIGAPQIPVLLVTSCTNKLFFLDPATNPATLVLTITTTVTPTGNWQAVTLRADKGDLLACQQPPTGQTAIYSIDFSSLNTIPDGTATLVRNGPTGATCAGIAWDSNDKTIYQTGLNTANQNVVFHFGEAVTSPATSVLANCPSGDSVTGISVAGTSLFVSCATPVASILDEIRQGYKVDNSPGGAVGDIAVTAPGTLAYDPVTFGSQFKDAIWTQGPGAQLRAIELPGGTSGQVLGVPVAFPGACPPLLQYFEDESDIPKDTDGDGLLDCWEDGTLWDDGRPGIRFDGIWPEGSPPYSIAGRDVTLCVESNGIVGIQPAVECASVTQKDIFIEIDYMQFHKPDPVAIAKVVTAFTNAPSPTAAQPAYPGPIRFHAQIDEQIPHVNATALLPCTPAPAAGDANFDSLKSQFFGTPGERGTPNGVNAKALAYHYALFVHNQSGTNNTTSGCAEVLGNDFMVSLGSWGAVLQPDGTTHNAGTTDQQSGTLMHELGHNLGLRHGGGDNTNCKPNYQSVMNYPLQFSNTITARPLDYSRQLLATLNEASLIETTGVGAPPVNLFNGKVAFGPQAGIPSKAIVATVNADRSLDWNRNGTVSATPVARDLNNLSISGCPALAGTFPANAQVLTGFDDWANIDFNFRASLDFAGGATSSIEQSSSEITLDQALSLSRDIIDIKPNDPKNTLSRNASQTIEVAMFSRLDDHGLLEFDARNLDPATMFLRGTGGATWALPVKRNGRGKLQCSVRDLNHDGAADLVCQFDFSKNTLSLGETQAVIEATTFDGKYDFHGSDSIRVVP